MAKDGLIKVIEGAINNDDNFPQDPTENQKGRKIECLQKEF